MSFDFHSLLPDIIIAVVLLLYILVGRSQGVVRKISGLVSLVLAVLGGKIAQKSLSPLVSERWLRSVVGDLLEHARASIGAEDMVDRLGDILAESKLPDFLKTGVLDKVTEKLSSTLDSVVGEATVVIADRLSQWLVFIAAALIIYIVVKLLFNVLLEPIIDGIGPLKACNHLLGAVLGGLTGLVVIGIVLLLVYKLFPALSAENGLLSSALVEKSFLTKFYFHAFPKLFC